MKISIGDKYIILLHPELATNTIIFPKGTINEVISICCVVSGSASGDGG
jgi:hypothetical protein